MMRTKWSFYHDDKTDKRRLKADIFFDQVYPANLGPMGVIT